MKTLLKSNLLYLDKTRRKLFLFTCFEHFPSVPKVRLPKSVTAISILLTAISICSRQFQFAHGNFNLLTAISITAISILLTAISMYSRQFHNFTQGNFNFCTATPTAFFASLTTCQLRRPTVATHQKSKRKIKSG